MKKGYTLIETITCVLIIISLISVVFVVFTKGIKYKVKAVSYYDSFNKVNEILDNFNRIIDQYDYSSISVSSNCLISDSILIFTYFNNILTFNYNEGIKYEIEYKDGFSFKLVNPKLLRIDIKLGDDLVTKYFYMGGN